MTIDKLEHEVRKLRREQTITRDLAKRALAVAAIGCGFATSHLHLAKCGMKALGWDGFIPGKWKSPLENNPIGDFIHRVVKEWL